MDPTTVCDGLWQRVIRGVDVSTLHGISLTYGRPKHVFYRKDEFGHVEKYTGTFKHPNCLIHAVLPGTTTPNGTFTCNVCALIACDHRFIKDVLQFDADQSKTMSPHKFTRHTNMTELEK